MPEQSRQLQEMYFSHAVTEALDEELARDPDVILMGEDIGVYGGAFGVTRGLFEKYGPNRVIMINAGHCGEGAGGGLKRVDRDVLRFDPDLVIICYWNNDMTSFRKIIEKIRSTGDAEVLLRTPNPVVAPNMPRVDPPVQAGKEWSTASKAEVAANIIKLSAELGVPVVDHYNQWIKADASHDGPGVTNPNKLWMRMSDASHPGPVGHLVFYRELAPAFGLPTKLSWEF